MTARFAARIARRRWLLSLITLLAAMLPIVATGTLWVLDAHSVVTHEQNVKAKLGTAKYQATLGGVQTLERVQAAEKLMRSQGVTFVRAPGYFGAHIVSGGVTYDVGALSAPWTDLFANSFTVHQGKLPVGSGEIAITPALEATGLHVGDQTMYAGRSRHVVGVITNSLNAGSIQTVFMDDPSDKLMQQYSGFSMRWLITSGSAPATKEGDEVSLLVESPSSMKGYRSKLSKDPVLFGGTILVTGALLLLCVRALTTRTLRRTERALRSVGASTGNVVAVESLACTIPVLAGVALGWVVFALVWWQVPDRVAAAHDIERGYPDVPWAGLGGLTLAAVVLAVLPVVVGVLWQRSGDITQSSAPRHPRGPLAIGSRVVLSHVVR